MADINVSPNKDKPGFLETLLSIVGTGLSAATGAATLGASIPATVAAGTVGGALGGASPLAGGLIQNASGAAQGVANIASPKQTAPKIPDPTQTPAADGSSAIGRAIDRTSQAPNIAIPQGMQALLNHSPAALGMSPEDHEQIYNLLAKAHVYGPSGIGMGDVGSNFPGNGTMDLGGISG